LAPVFRLASFRDRKSEKPVLSIPTNKKKLRKMSVEGWTIVSPRSACT